MPTSSFTEYRDERYINGGSLVTRRAARVWGAERVRWRLPGLSGAKGIPTEWLEGSLFTDYFIPSVILFVIVGGSFLVAAIAVFARWRSARVITLGAGAIVLGWLAVQVSIIGYVSWMQPTTLVAALVILALAGQLSE